MKIEKPSITKLQSLNTLLSKYYSEYYINKNGIIIGIPLNTGIRIRMVINPTKDIFNDIYVQPNKLRTFLANVKMKNTQLDEESDRFIFTTKVDDEESYIEIPRHEYPKLKLAKLEKTEPYISNIFDSRDDLEYKRVSDDVIQDIIGKHFVQLANGAYISLFIIPDINKTLFVEYADISKDMIPEEERVDDSNFMVLHVAYEISANNIIEIYSICKFVF